MGNTTNDVWISLVGLPLVASKLPATEYSMEILEVKRMKNEYMPGKILFATLAPIFALLLMAGIIFTEASLGASAASAAEEAASVQETRAMGIGGNSLAATPQLCRPEQGCVAGCAASGTCDASNDLTIDTGGYDPTRQYLAGLAPTLSNNDEIRYRDYSGNGAVDAAGAMPLARSLNLNFPFQRPCGEGLDLCNWDVALPLGSPDVSSCSLQYNTYWELNTDATATCTFDGSQYLNHTLYISIDNDVINCTLNGDLIMDATMHEGCAPQDPRNGYQIALEPTSGQNTVICNVRDRGIQSFFDSCVVGEGEPFTPDCRMITSCSDCAGHGMCDANDDGTINSSDVARIQEYLAMISPTCGYNGYSCYCDVNGSAGVTAYDATVIARCITPPSYCGNSIIEGGETCDGAAVTLGYICSGDCMTETLIPVCGDGICYGGETSSNCAKDCRSVKSARSSSGRVKK